MPQSFDVPYATEAIRMYECLELIDKSKNRTDLLDMAILQIHDHFFDCIKMFGKQKCYPDDSLEALKQINTDLYYEPEQVGSSGMLNFSDKHFPALREAAQTIVNNALKNGIVEDDLNLYTPDTALKIIENHWEIFDDDLVLKC